MTFAKWAPMALIKAYDDEQDPIVQQALLRLGNEACMKDIWLNLPTPDDVVPKLKTAAIFYWQTKDLDSPSKHAADIRAMRKHINELQSYMRHTFSADNPGLYEQLEVYRNGLNEHAYKAFYAQPRQHLLWLLYRFTDSIYGAPKHSVVAALASVIANEVISKEDVQPSYKKFKG
ncbi:hypothetical protein [Polynucleobacter antarcticus]|uniref:Uncharacterized protein n=1 Tax=Polynucleobacter antarcticus TaxID=1743162 RepID=A0A6M9PVI3_9BURK|nr:hypothetical protein [Polynucleobacter antarcticus]QKM62947.1 hypothetical protein DCO16_07690 [Polynucleobacter antarcticus]